jgi:hypothetical protein
LGISGGRSLNGRRWSWLGSTYYLKLRKKLFVLYSINIPLSLDVDNVFSTAASSSTVAVASGRVSAINNKWK